MAEIPSDVSNKNKKPEIQTSHDTTRELATAVAKRTKAEQSPTGSSSSGDASPQLARKKSRLESWGLPTVSDLHKDSQFEKSRDGIFNEVDSELKQRVTMPLDLRALQGYREKRNRVLESIKGVDMEDDSIEARIMSLEESIGRAGTDGKLSTSLERVEEWKRTNVDTTEHLTIETEDLEERRENVKGLIQSLQRMKETHAESSHDVQERLDRLHSHKSDLDETIKAHNTFIRELRYELDIYDQEEGEGSAFLSPHQFREKENGDESLRDTVFENPRELDCGPHCISRVVSLYHSDADINEVYEKVYRDHGASDASEDKPFSPATTEIAESLRDSLPIHDQHGDRIFYIPMVNFSFKDLESSMKIKDNKGNNVPVILNLEHVRLQDKDYTGIDYKYMSSPDENHAVVVRLNHDQTYDLWTPNNHYTVNRLEHLYELTYADKREENEAVIPFFEHEYRQVESWPQASDKNQIFIEGRGLPPRD